MLTRTVQAVPLLTFGPPKFDTDSKNDNPLQEGLEAMGTGSILEICTITRYPAQAPSMLFFCHVFHPLPPRFSCSASRQGARNDESQRGGVANGTDLKSLMNEFLKKKKKREMTAAMLQNWFNIIVRI
ncbi:hypothetical protein CXB51_024352 [Gossypium anomalum]|uniref:Uncharacterized protein n=1 Tax=Gossypium anomalum TaxID=47600 RepID=A0A8J6CT80_9ROSI|nr:hypothetical protein CXB51_024352 [Gossypium anomalum]